MPNKLRHHDGFTPFIITGMARSVTTLLDRLLDSHEQMIAVSQPLPWLYRHLKTLFFQDKKIPVDKYVLNDLFNESRYSPKNFCDFLEMYTLNRHDLKYIFASMEGWSGRYYKRYDVENLVVLGKGCTLQEFYLLFLKLLLSSETNQYFGAIGTKEILVEEYIPYFVQSGIKSIIIVRDPRDVITSLNVGIGSKYGGGHRPTLFHLRNWRKSIAVANSYQSEVLLIRYEDLLSDTYQTLNKITTFLGENSFPDGYFDKGIKDTSGENWIGNSSTEVHTGINRSNVGKFGQYLNTKMIKYIEYFCKPEMNMLNYKLTSSTQLPKHFQEQFEVGEYGIDPNMSTKPEELDLEMRRLEILESPTIKDKELVRNLFYSIENFEALIDKKYQ